MEQLRLIKVQLQEVTLKLDESNSKNAEITIQLINKEKDMRDLELNIDRIHRDLSAKVSENTKLNQRNDQYKERIIVLESSLKKAEEEVETKTKEVAAKKMKIHQLKRTNDLLALRYFLIYYIY